MVLYRIAMRTARPLKTWWAMRFSSSSAMSEAISTPRLMGPGQRVMHPGPINRGVEIASDIADDEHAQAFEVATQVLPHAEEVEQALRRVLVLTVAGVDDAGLGVRGERLAGAGGRVAHDDDVG